ncbi:variable surface lipoprotein [Metamycoplasma alkalescens]|uniref:Lipoprotein n=2 Tax=Metamycoplasma alkalescens TaxID=45363 RepID=N9SQY6_9BACT|nr:variable surface lipoprotein [Metamycoplasma alkalescens]ENY53875.1 Hypothetical protein, predicted lipoprotein [Metamycoplasma alkalescens 14918]SYV90470.1 Uncharacterised protein [Metamycoplasma alkalescens]
MKKSSKLLLSLSSISVVSLPLLAISCTETEKQLFEKEIKSVEDYIKNTKDLKEEIKDKLNKKVTEAKEQLNKLEKDEEIKKAREAFKKEVEEIKKG